MFPFGQGSGSPQQIKQTDNIPKLPFCPFNVSPGDEHTWGNQNQLIERDNSRIVYMDPLEKRRR